MSPPKRQRVANPLFAAPFSYRRVLRLSAGIGEFPTGDLSMGPGFDLRVHSGIALPDRRDRERFESADQLEHVMYLPRPAIRADLGR